MGVRPPRAGLEPPSNGVLVNISLQGNTNYLGLPLCAALLGTDHLPEAIAYDSFVQAPVFLLGVFGVAAAMGTKAGGSAGERVRTFLFKNPVLLAVVAGLLAPAALAPAALVDVSHVIVFAALPWGFFCAGVILAEHLERGAAVRPALSPPVGAAIVMRLVLAPLLLLLLAAPFIDLPPAYLLAAATPAGLNGLTVAHAYGLDLRYAASSLAWTTGIGVTGMSALALALVRALVQRVSRASVTVGGERVSEIGPGLLVLLVTHDDRPEHADRLAEKVLRCGSSRTTRAA